MLLPVLWLAAIGTRIAGGGLSRRARRHGLRRRADHRRRGQPTGAVALVSLLVAGLISLSVQRAVESRRAQRGALPHAGRPPAGHGRAHLRPRLRYDLAAGRGLDTLGVDPATFEGKTLYDVVDEERRPALEKIYLEALDGGESSLEWRSGRNPGRDLWLRGGPPARRRGARAGRDGRVPGRDRAKPGGGLGARGSGAVPPRVRGRRDRDGDRLARRALPPRQPRDVPHPRPARGRDPRAGRSPRSRTPTTAERASRRWTR